MGGTGVGGGAVGTGCCVVGGTRVGGGAVGTG